jgi:predicted glycosyltransferase
MNGSPPTVLFYCEHSLGLGQLVRSLALAAALTRDFRVVLLNGGRLPRGTVVPEGVELVPLPPLSTGADGALVSGDGRRSVARTIEVRRERILHVQRAIAPDLVLVERFPFAGREFHGELMALLHAARASGARTVCSLRDILPGPVAGQARGGDGAGRLAGELLDAILVHADPRFARPEESGRTKAPLAVPVHYTGFVAAAGPAPAVAPARAPGRPRVVVSAGGGRHGERLLAIALDAYRLSLAPRGVRLRLLTGPYFPDAPWRALRRIAAVTPGIDVRHSVADLPIELAGAVGSVSQCGYNTALDIVRSRVPALVVPFTQGGDDEQLRRAERLAGLGALRVLREERLTAATLAAELDELLDFQPARVDLDLDGAAVSARILASLVTPVAPAPLQLAV